MEANNNYHIPVMLEPCLDGLKINPEGVYVDVTFGGGGHSRAIFEKLSPKGHLISFDQDQDAAKNAWDAPNFHFVQSNFSFMKNHLRALGFPKVDGILADLGVSSFQFDAGERGFSIRSNDALDMRMNQQADLSAHKLLHTYESEELKQIFYKYADLKKVPQICSAILKARENNTLETTGDLLDAIRPLAPKFKEHKFFAQVFQAIRIEVNQEMQVLEELLQQGAEVLKPEGRFVVMSYHSIEDRMVKNFFKRGNLDGTIEKDFYGNILKDFDEVNRHPIVSDEEELERNSRARSAKLRIASKR